MPAYGTFKYGTLKYGSGWTFELNSYVSIYRGYRFNALIASQGTQIFDKAVDANDTVYLRYLIEGVLLAFDPARDIIHLISLGINDLQAADKSSWTLFSLDSGADKLFLSGDDYHDGRDMKWMIGFVPFDVSLLNESDWSGDETLSGTESQNIVINGYPAGSYRAFVYVTGSGDEEATFTITGAVVTSGDTTISSIPAAGKYGYVDFIAGVSDNITYTVARVSGTGDVTLGNLIIFPLSNKKNFPLDYHNRALMIPDITELGGKL